MLKKKSKKKEKIEVQLRPPVVTIMGHVDHGKTSLLDYIRKTSVAAREAGGITQHIGAYQVNINDKKITFIDTPGHEAFAKMRARGAKVTDIIILVISAVDGVMPQTVESIEHIKSANVPYIVAINKADLPEANIEKIKRQLVKNDVLVEGMGGDVVTIPVSAKTGLGVKDLLEMITLIAEMSPEKFKDDPTGKLEAYIIESKLDKSCGPLSTILVKNGTLRVGDEISVDGTKSRIRAMRNELGVGMSLASPSTPVEILGLEIVPEVGSKVSRFGEEIIEIKEEAPKKEEIPTELPLTLPEIPNDTKIKIILKADVAGSIEALMYCFPEEVVILEKGVGEISESDVLMAKTVGAVILGFNVKISKNVEKLAETEKVMVKTYKIIYEMLEELKDVIVELKKPKITEKILGKAKIIAEFSGTVGKIAGSKVIEGRFTKSDQVRIERETKIVFDGLKIKTLHQLKKEIDKASMGMECGIILDKEVDFRVGDMLISYRKLE